ncbi:MAG TPA: WXG100 family type VII secretion target [Streptosporangiaceae bacterium]|nr:WXG100 family type VII secretion target [Streptosporangiaceae bacterium]
MAMVGADLGLGQKLASDFTTGGQDLQAAVSKLSSAVNESHSFWTGPGANKFRDEWAQFLPQANKMIAAVQQDAPQAIKAAMDAIQHATGVS